MTFDLMIVVDKDYEWNELVAFYAGFFYKLPSCRFFVRFILFFVTAWDAVHTGKRLRLTMDQQGFPHPDRYYGYKLQIVGSNAIFGAAFYKFIRHAISIPKVWFVLSLPEDGIE